MDFKALIRPHLYTLKPYSSARDEYDGDEGIFMDANENPFGSVSFEKLNRYPDPHQKAIKNKLSKLKGVKPENIFLGNGSDEPIDLLIKAVCEPQESNIVIMPPTYGMYKVCADIQQIRIQEAPLSDDFQIDLDNVFDAVNSATKMIWICSPNNPSGNILKRESIFQILKAFPEKLVIIDEAYIDFAPENTFIKDLGIFENLVILQTFSKAWGMAGLRVGAAYAHPELIKILNKIKYPYNLNILSQAKLLESIDKEDIKNKFVADIINLRTTLALELNNLDIVEKIYPSDSNMLLVKFKDSKKVFDYLINHKIILRDRSNVALCENCIRITVGTVEENAVLLERLKEFGG